MTPTREPSPEPTRPPTRAERLAARRSRTRWNTFVVLVICAQACYALLVRHQPIEGLLWFAIGVLVIAVDDIRRIRDVIERTEES